MDCANAQYPPITSKLRKAFMASGGIATLDGCVVKEYMTIAKSELDDLCDTIDAIHARLEAAYDRLRAEGEHDYAPESHYVMLPKDADGVPIHVGDVMEWPDGETFEVIGIGGNTLFFIKDGLAEWVDARNKRHHNPDTWERIIEDAREYMLNIGGSYLWKNKSDELVARCKALAGDGTGGRNEHH